MVRASTDDDRHADDPELVRLIAIALEMREQGIEPPIDEICKERRDLIERVEAAIHRADRLPELQRASDDFDAYAGRLLIGRYQLLTRVGAGSMGVVYVAEDRELHRRVAIKILRSELLNSAESEARFEREAKVLAAVRHRSVVPIYDRGRTDDGLMFLVMELLEGQSLANRLSAPDPTHDLRDAAGWIAELAEGLHSAHTSGVFHRDVKPSNVFLRKDCSPVLLDFGIATLDAEPTVRDGADALGTPAYMAPEALDPNVPPGAALDVYGLTATLYHLVTRRAPFEGTPSQIIAQLQRRDPVPPAQLVPGLPRDLLAILEQGMAREPYRRYRDALELSEDLRSFLAHRPVRARPLTPFSRAWRRLRRSREFRVGATVALLAGVTMTVWLGKDAWAAEQRKEWLATWAQLPPTRAMSPRATREIPDPAQRAFVREILDRAVQLGVEPVPSLLRRAAFRVDHGDPRGAAEDMRALATRLGTPFVQALASHYDELPDSHRGAPVVALESLPPRESALEHYVAEHHRIRNRSTHPEDFGAAIECLSRPELRDLHFAQELALQVQAELTVQAPSRERRALRRKSHDLANRLEAKLGRRTASTRLAIGRTLYAQRRFPESIRAFEEGLELAPSDLALQINLGAALQATGALDDALDAFESALERGPGSRGAHERLILFLLETEEFVRALETVDRTPYPDTEEGARLRHRMRGKTQFARAMVARQANDDENTLRFAELAHEEFVASRNPDSDYTPVDAAVASALASGSPNRLLTTVARHLKRDPLKPVHLRILASLVTDTLDSTQTEALREFLFELANQVSPHR